MILFNRPKILFFDLGNVFISDDPPGCYIYQQLYEALAAQASPCEVAEFFARREQHFLTGGFLWGYVRSCLPTADYDDFRKRVRGEIFSRWQEFSPAIPGMEHAARQLAKHYRLGVIANQPSEVDELLEVRGLRELFEVCAVSETLGWDKPDPRIFQWALEQAKVQAHEAVMIGDRIDNDVRPAKALGMRTLWLRLGFQARGWEPQTDFEHCYRRSLEAVNFSLFAPRCPQDEPDLIADSPQDLVKRLLPVSDQKSFSGLLAEA